MKVSSKKVKRSSKGKKLRRFLILGFLLLAVCLTVFLVRRQLDIRQHATGDQATITVSPASAVLGDTVIVSWQLATAATSTDSSSCTDDSQCSVNNKCFHYSTYAGTCKPSDTVCAQAIVNACNPANPTECVDFPNTCYVPPGWTPAQSIRQNPSSCTDDSQCVANNTCFHYLTYPGTCKPSDTVCAQAIVHACNPDNPQECDDFPNSCVVPPGWTTTQPTRGAACSPRPTIKRTVGVDNVNKLVTVTASVGKTNTLHGIKFTSISNATLIVPSNWILTNPGESNPIYMFPANTTTVSFQEKRIACGNVTVAYKWIDDCGEYSDFSGAGTSASGLTCTQGFNLPSVDVVQKVYAQAAVTGGETIQFFRSGTNTAVGSKRYLDCQTIPTTSPSTNPVPPSSPVISGSCRILISDDFSLGSYIARIYAADGATVIGESNALIIQSVTDSGLPNFTNKTGAYCNGSISRVHLEWTPVMGVTGYNVKRRNLGTNTYTTVESPTHFAFNDETVTAGAQYNYYIEAIIPGQANIVGVDRDVTVPADCSSLTPVTTKPNFTNKTGTYCNGSNSRVHLEWTPVAGASYRVLRRNLGITDHAVLGETSGVGFNDETVTSGTQYNYVIQAIVPGQQSPINGDSQDMEAVSCGN